ncbi:putative F-box only protein 15 [Cardamine amara subsp. amara]|uniref:F-box only protein 15 n=1 Tax=Cardamine amara subsp. amara TaxID=228776 RepID=A0ABD1BZV7_CARAN
MDPVKIIQSDLPIPDEFRVPYPIIFMVHCDGLMLCKCDDWRARGRSKDGGLAVWNPVMRKIKWIEPSYCYRKTDSFGFGYKNSCRDNYKILRFPGPLCDRDPECEIYEFKSDSWRSLNAKFDWEVDMECRGVSVKGNMYWLAEKKEDFILSFDFSNETFNDICVCPRPCELRRLGCFNGDRLSLLQQNDEEETINEIEVWMTNKLSDDGVVSFTKYFNVNTPDLPDLLYHTDMARPGYSIGKYRNIMAWCEQDVRKDDKWYTCNTLYDIDESGIRRQKETGGRRFDDHEYYYLFICSYVYVPSLVSCS